MHYDDQDVVVVYTLVKIFLRVLRVLRGLRVLRVMRVLRVLTVLMVLYGIPSNCRFIVFYGDCHSYSSKYVYLETRALPCKPRSDFEPATSIT